MKYTVPIHMDDQNNGSGDIMQKVYGWMFVGLLVTAGVAYWVSISPTLVQMFLGNAIAFYGLMIVEILAVFFLASMAQRMSAATAMLVFLAYAALNGITFSLIFLIYTSSSIAAVFIATAGIFGLMSLYGYMTKRDLTSVGNFATMALIGLILASLVNLFFSNSTVDSIITYVGVFVFVALTAYDTQKIRELGGDDEQEAIVGALVLYLDFINLFLDLLRLSGGERKE